MRYRSEATFGQEYRDAAEVMSFETFELGNTDIISTLKNNILKDSPLKYKLGVYEKALDEDYLNINYDDYGKQFFKEVVNEINKITGKDIKYCLWLADIEGVKSYSTEEDGELSDDLIDAYEESDIILSELGFDGTLYGYEELPKQMKR